MALTLALTGCTELIERLLAPPPFASPSPAGSAGSDAVTVLAGPGFNGLLASWHPGARTATRTASGLTLSWSLLDATMRQLDFSSPAREFGAGQRFLIQAIGTAAGTTMTYRESVNGLPRAWASAGGGQLIVLERLGGTAVVQLDQVAFSPWTTFPSAASGSCTMSFRGTVTLSGF